MATVRAYVGQEGADLWVAPAGTDNILRASGVLPLSALDEVRAVPGVASADALLRIFVSAAPEAGGRKLTLMAFGYRAPWGAGGPPQLVAGRAPERSGEAALDRAAAHRLGVRVGGQVRVSGEAMEVVGLTGGTNLLATQLAFLELGAAQRTSGLTDKASFVVVRLAPGADVEAVRQRLSEQLPGATITPRAEFVANSVREAVAGVLPVLGLVALLGVAVATVLVALLGHGILEDRRSDIAVLLLLGSAPARVARGLVAHALLLVLAGSAVGAGLAWGLSVTLDRVQPTIELAFAARDVVLVLSVFTAAGMAGVLMPVLRLRHIDPLEAFRA